MRLRTKALIFVCSTLAVLIGGVSIVGSQVLMQGFLEVESKTRSQDALRARDAIIGLSENLSVKLSDWANWDDAYKFAEDRNEDFLKSNLQYASMKNLGLSWIMFLTPDNRLVYGGMLNHETASLDAIPPDMFLDLTTLHTSVVTTDAKTEHHGLMELAGKTYIVAVRAILTSNADGEPHGSILFATELDDAAVRGVAERLRNKLDFFKADAPEFRPEDLRALRSSRESPSVAVVPESHEQVGVFTFVPDIYARDGYVIKATMHRYTYQQGRSTLRAFLIVLGLMGVTTAGLCYAMLGRIVLARLLNLEAGVRSIAASDQFTGAVPETGSDELGALGRSINDLIQQVQNSQHELRESEARFRQLSEVVPAFIWISDADNKTLWVNEAWTEFSGLDIAQTSGMGWVDAIHPDDRAATKESSDRANRTQAAFEREFRVRRRDGTWRWLIDRGTPRHAADGTFAGHIGCAFDVTDRKDAEISLQRYAEDLLRSKTVEQEQARQMGIQNAALEQARDLAEAASRSKSEFLANMSHEIRTPMTAILGYADLLLDAGHSADERVSCVQTIRRNGEHLLTLINDILDLSKIEAGRMNVEQIAVEPRQIASEVFGLMNVRAVQKKVELNLDIDPRVPTCIRTDPHRLRQILLNLVSNAVKFTENGSVVIAMWLEESATTGEIGTLLFEVRDTGIGMTPDQVTALFNPFTQADGSTTRRFGGTGLGLSISRRLAELLGGSLMVASASGVGSTFSLRIPAVQLQRSVPAPDLAPSAAGAGNAPLSGRRVLLAEDGPDNQRLITAFLRKAGAVVEVAANGRIALDLALEASENGTPFDMILMDMQMPEMDGYTATSRLRASGFNRPVIALTAHAMAEDRQHCIDAGCNDYATKPVDRATLITMCARWAAVGHAAGAAAGEGSQENRA